ncbi:hypothetical protein Tco_0712192 [Tanacetum coccineum]
MNIDYAIIHLEQINFCTEDRGTNSERFKPSRLSFRTKRLEANRSGYGLVRVGVPRFLLSSCPMVGLNDIGSLDFTRVVILITFSRLSQSKIELPTSVDLIFRARITAVEYKDILHEVSLEHQDIDVEL